MTPYCIPTLSPRIMTCTYLNHYYLRMLPYNLQLFWPNDFGEDLKNSIYSNVKNSIFYCGPTLPSGIMSWNTFWECLQFFWPICFLRRKFLMISLYIFLCKTLIPLRMWSNPTLRIMILTNICLHCMTLLPHNLLFLWPNGSWEGCFYRFSIYSHEKVNLPLTYHLIMTPP